MNPFICPRCRAPLLPDETGLTCAHGHHLDRAREGYINFLLANQKNSRAPGDAREQLLARRQFLQTGYYQPLAQALAEAVPAQAQSLLDLGCGEGYFTRAIAAHLGAQAQIYAMDIAKPAIQLAARQQRSSNGATVEYGVASSYQVPIADHAIEVICRVNAPSSATELQRLLVKNGVLIIVSPAEEHLLSLRKAIYQTVRPHPQPQAPEGFSLVQQRRINHDLAPDSERDVEALLAMTPFAWRLSPELKEQLMAQGLRDRADFHLCVYTRIS